MITSSSSAGHSPRNRLRCVTHETATKHDLRIVQQRYSLFMRWVLMVLVGISALPSFAQYPSLDWPSSDPPPFEVYALASGLGTIDATQNTPIIQNPQPGQDFGTTPKSFASGARVGFVWRHANVGLLADLGFHKYADHTGSTSLAPLIVGVRFYSNEAFRSSVFAEGLAGAYRWTEHGERATFTTVKGLVGIGGGVDIRLTRTVVFRLGEIQLLVAGASTGPSLTESASSGLAFRFGK